MTEGIAGWFNSIVNYGVSIIWGNNEWLVASNPWYGLLMFETRNNFHIWPKWRN